MSWVLTLLGICALIVLHELGHFVAAKAVGMRVERFSLFFPPTLFKVRWGETEYGIGAIPLGGYVKITGMNPEELKPAPAKVPAGADTGRVPVAATATAMSAGAVAAPPDQLPPAGAARDAPIAPADTAAQDEIDPELLRRAYYNQPTWKRVVVIAAGPR